MEREVEAPDAGRPARLVHHARQDVDERRFARAVGAEQPENLPARHVECHIVERLLAALVSFGEGIDFDGVLHGVRLSHEPAIARSEEHTSELQSLMRISYAVFCLKKKKKQRQYL